MTRLLDLAHIAQRLSDHTAESLPPPSLAWDRASVSLMLAGPADSLRLCFIQRAIRDGDPWSGQMALPGGRASATDEDKLMVAVRETHEEVGIRLSRAQCIGTLSDFSIGRGGHVRNGVLSPFVFYIGQSTPSLRPEVAEVAAAFWVDLAHLWDDSNWSDKEWGNTRYPGVLYRDQLIWGLTLRVLAEFSRVVDYPLPVCEPTG